VGRDLAVRAAATAATVPGERVFSATLVGRIAYVAFPIPRFICVEVVESRFAAAGERAVVAVMRVEAIVDVAVKAAVAMKPGAGSDEDSTQEPVWPVVAVGCAVVGSVVEVAIGANGSHSNVDSDLGWGGQCGWRGAEQGSCEN